MTEKSSDSRFRKDQASASKQRAIAKFLPSAWMFFNFFYQIQAQMFANCISILQNSGFCEAHNGCGFYFASCFIKNFLAKEFFQVIIRISVFLSFLNIS